MALDHNWLPWQTGACDPDFLAELIAAKSARADYQLFSVEKPDKDTKKLQGIRKAELAQQREAVRRGESGST